MPGSAGDTARQVCLRGKPMSTLKKQYITVT